MKKRALIVFALLPSIAVSQGNTENSDGKLAEDPTRIRTKVGISYTDNFDFDNAGAKVDLSLALDAIRKINFKIDNEALEWSVGGSWLFDFGILNFNVGRSEYTETNTTQNRYNIGTFVPLSSFGFTPAGIQLFPMAGLSYNDGDIICEDNDTHAECADISFKLDSNGLPIAVETPLSNYGGYVGIFGLRPVGKKTTLMGGIGTTVASDDYLSIWGGVGVSYSFNKQNSLNIMASLSDSDFGRNEQISLNYKYQL